MLMIQLHHIVIYLSVQLKQFNKYLIQLTQFNKYLIDFAQ